MKRNIAGFFRYARSRHQVYLNRRDGHSRPWTKDPILQTYRFTNVFRELDKTTVWFRKNVRDPMRCTEEVLLATVVFRLLNRIEVGEAIWCQSDLEYESAWSQFCEKGFDVRVLRRAIRANCGDGPYVTGAYIISSPAGMPKLDGVLDVIKKFTWRARHVAGGWQKLAHMMQVDRWSLEQAHDCLKTFDYFGPFHAYEIVTDLRHTNLLCDAPDIMTWANPGPGAHRGANRVFRGDKRDKVSREQVIDEMRILLSWSRDPKYWPQDWPKWEMRDVEHTLCEFDKYERVRLGEGKPRGVYR